MCHTFYVLPFGVINHDDGNCSAKYDSTATQALVGEILKILSWAYLKYCRFIWQTDCICQLWLPVTNTAYLVGFTGP